MKGRPRKHTIDERIEQATLRLLIERPYHKFSLSRVAQLAGVGKAAVYGRYTSNEDLISSVLAARGAPMPPLSADCKQDLIAYLIGYRQAIEQVGLQILSVIFANSSEPHLIDLHRQRLIAPRAQYSRSLLSRAQEGGYIAKTANLDAIMEALIGSLWVHLVVGNSSARWPEDVIATFWNDDPGI